VEHWDLTAVQVAGTTPVVLATEDQARAILIRLEPGQEYQVLEGAWFVVLEGGAEFTANDKIVAAEAGALVQFEPGERREVRSDTGARLLLFLAPWPGEGHYRAEEREVG
jgi:quercetin dioxygenase-like cupin family protein